MSALIRIQISSQSARVRPGEQTDLTLTVQNFSEVVDRYRIQVEGVDPAWVSLSRDEIALFPKDQDQVRITFHPPSGPGARADRYDCRILAVSQENPGEQSAVDIQLEVAMLPALALNLRPQRATGTTEGTFSLQVTNQGNADLTVQLEATDPEDGLLYSFSPQSFALPAGQERAVELSVRPKVPLSGDQAKSYFFTIAARVAEADRVSQRVQGEWVQTPPSFDLVLRPQKGSGMGEGTFSLQVTNQGSADLTVQLEASDPEEGLLYAFEPPRLAVPAGQEQSVKLRLRPRAPLSGDQPRTYTFTVTARPAEMPKLTRQVQGEWVQTPPSFELLLHPQKGSGVSEGKFALRVNNPGSSDLTLLFEAADTEFGCQYTFDPPELAVPAGQARSVVMGVRPRTPLIGAQPKAYAFTITARPNEAPQLSRQVQGEWMQMPPTFELSLQPQKQTSAAAGTFSVQVRNLGTADLDVQLEAADPATACLYTFTPAHTTVPGAQTRIVQLRVQSRTPLRGEQPKTHLFTVTARPAAAPASTQQVQGEWVQVPQRWSMVATVAAILLTCIGWVIGWAIFGASAEPSGFWQAVEPLKEWVASLNVDWTIVEAVPWVIRGAIAGAIGGLFTALALLVAEKSVRLKGLITVFLLWTLGWAIGVACAPITGLPFTGGQPILFWAIVGGVVGIVGGLATAVVPRKSKAPLGGGQIIIVTLGWAIGWILGEVVVEWAVQQGVTWNILGFVLGIIGGLIGGTATFWQVSEAQRKASAR